MTVAYAMTVHKAQGQTLPCVAVDVTRVFAEGQIYSALGRAVDHTRLKIMGNISMKMPLASPEVIHLENSTAWRRIDNSGVT